MSSLLIRGLVCAGGMLVGGCAKPTLQPMPANGLEWQNRSLVNRAIDRLFMADGIFWSNWQLAGSLIVVDHQIATPYRAMVVETVFDSLANPNPCRPNRITTLYGWRARADTIGIDALMATTVLPSADPRGGGIIENRRICPDPMSMWATRLGIFSIAGTAIFGGRDVRNGEIYVRAIEPRDGASRPCEPLPGAARLEDTSRRCERVDFTVSIRASVPRAEHPADTAPPGVSDFGVTMLDPVPGIRFRYDCREPQRPCPAPGVSVLPVATWGRPYLDTTRSLTAVGADRVFRSTVFLRFKDSVTDAGKLAFFNRGGTNPAGRTPAGSFWVHIPDPGPVGFHRAIEQLRAAPEVRSVYPITVKLGLLGPSALRVATVRTASGAPARGIMVCMGVPQFIGLDNQRCQKVDPSGTVFLTLPSPGDAMYHAACRRRGETSVSVLDSAAAAFGSEMGDRLEFTVPDVGCDDRPLVDSGGNWSGYLSGQPDSIVFHSVNRAYRPAWVNRSLIELVRLPGWPTELHPHGCFQGTLRGRLTGPAAFGPSGGFEYQLEPASVATIERIAESRCYPTLGADSSGWPDVEMAPSRSASGPLPGDSEKELARLEREALAAFDPHARSRAVAEIHFRYGRKQAGATPRAGVVARLARIYRAADPVLRAQIVQLMAAAAELGPAAAFLARVAEEQAPPSPKPRPGIILVDDDMIGPIQFQAITTLPGLGPDGERALRALHARKRVTEARSRRFLDQLAASGFRVSTPR